MYTQCHIYILYSAGNGVQQWFIKALNMIVQVCVNVIATCVHIIYNLLLDLANRLCKEADK